MRKQSWKAIQRKYGGEILEWLNRSNQLDKKLDEVSEALYEILSDKVASEKSARMVWDAVPAVLAKCNDQKTYELPGAPLAYAWLHLLDRYVRSWVALNFLLEKCLLPMASKGINALDIGTGPGPSGFAISDFYNSLSDYFESIGKPEYGQPIKVNCVEYDQSTNYLRHNLAELLYAKYRPGSNRESSVLSLCNAIQDFGDLKPVEERKKTRSTLQSEEYELFDVIHSRVDYEPVYSAQEINHHVQSIHRYKFIVFSNFLTTTGTVQKFKSNIIELLNDANAGTVLLVIGGIGKVYPEIYQFVDTIAEEAGFKCVIENQKVRSEDSGCSDKIYKEGLRFFDHLSGLAKDHSEETKVVRSYFSGNRTVLPFSQIRAYRKPGTSDRNKSSLDPSKSQPS